VIPASDHYCGYCGEANANPGHGVRGRQGALILILWWCAIGC
jgi:hypothetical protein